MPKISFVSAALSHLEMFCPHLPSEPERSGNYMFHFNGTMYDVTAETLTAIREQFHNWGPQYSSVIRLTEHVDVPATVAETVAATVTEPAPIVPEVVPEVVTEATEPAAVPELTELELEEVQVAVNLLDGKTIAQATPILEATAADESKSLLWRQTYAEYASTEEKLPKGLRTIAADLYCAMI
jgi:hypothetical protein